MMQYFFLNQHFHLIDEKIIAHTNRSFRYGDGLFETMRIENRTICLKNYHFERLTKSMKILNLHFPAHINLEYVEEKILHLVKKNNVEKLARVRLNVFRGDGGLYDYKNNTANVLIEAMPLSPTYQWNINGLDIGVYPLAKKSCDIFSNIKSNNYLPYIMAAQYATQQKWNDALVLNIYNRISDSTIANIFWIKENKIYTTPLSEGAVDGVMRRHLLTTLQNNHTPVIELPLTSEILQQSDEVFLTNALFGIRWVKSFQDKTFTNFESFNIFNKYILQ